MFDGLTRLLDDADLMPHGVCFAWRPDLVYLHVVSDVVITAAYLAIPVVLLQLIRHRRDLLHSWVLYLFGAFILLCGLTHAANIYVLWSPDYGLQGVVKAATALVSIATAVALIPLLPKLLSLPSQRQLLDANEALARQMAEREAAEAQSRQKAEELAAVNEELERFAYVASHDMRAPLRGVGNLVDWLEEDLGIGVDADAKKKMTLIRGRIQRLEQMLNDLLDYSRAGRAAEKTEAIDTGEAIRRWFDDLNIDSRFRLELPPAMPVISGARIAFEQVIANLIGNAMKHHDRASGTLRVGVERMKESYRFSVADDGPGIPSQSHDRVFNLFETLQSRDSKDSSGMGLAIVRKLVQRVGGDIRIESVDGRRGTAILFDWPSGAAEGRMA